MVSGFRGSRKRKVDLDKDQRSSDDSSRDKLQYAAEEGYEDSEKECKPIQFDTKDTKRVEAVERQVVIWKQWMKTAEYHQEDEWRKAHRAWRLVDKYTGHKSVQPFKVHKKDVEMFELDSISQKDKIKMEKVLKEHQSLHGGVGANVTGMIVAYEDMDKTLRDTWKLFKEGVYEE